MDALNKTEFPRASWLRPNRFPSQRSAGDTLCGEFPGSNQDGDAKAPCRSSYSRGSTVLDDKAIARLLYSGPKRHCSLIMNTVFQTLSGVDLTGGGIGIHSASTAGSVRMHTCRLCGFDSHPVSQSKREVRVQIPVELLRSPWCNSSSIETPASKCRKAPLSLSPGHLLECVHPQISPSRNPGDLDLSRNASRNKNRIPFTVSLTCRAIRPILAQRRSRVLSRFFFCLARTGIWHMRFRAIFVHATKPIGSWQVPVFHVRET